MTWQGNGAFIHSCHTHCEAQSPAWNNFKINGLSMQQLNSKWWNSDFKQYVFVRRTAAASHSSVHS